MNQFEKDLKESYKLIPKKTGRYNISYSLIYGKDKTLTNIDLDMKLPYGLVMILNDNKIENVIDNTTIGSPREWARDKDIILKTEINIKEKGKYEKKWIKKTLIDILYDAFNPYYAWEE